MQVSTVHRNEQRMEEEILPIILDNLVHFYYDFSKKDPVLLTQTIGTIAYMLDDSNVNVMKRVMLACMSLYKAAIQVCVSLYILLLYI